MGVWQWPGREEAEPGFTSLSPFSLGHPSKDLWGAVVENP